MSLTPLPFSFSQPLWLWALVPVVGVIIWAARDSLSGLRGGRARVSNGLRLALVLALLLALAGARIEWRSRDLTVIFAIDRSESVPAAETDRALALINQALATKRPQDQAGVMVFGEDALVEREPTPGLKRLERLQSAPASKGYTNLAKALRLGMGLFPPGTQKRLVLLTDGNENLGSAATEAGLAAGSDIAVDIITLAPAAADEVLVDSVQVPERVERNKPFDVRITVQATRDGPATIRLLRNRNAIAQSEVQLTQGKNVFLFPQSEADGGYNTYEAQVDATADTVRDNNAATAYAVIEGEPKVLLVGRDEDTRTLSEALKQQNIPTEVLPNVPATAADLENYGAVFLVNASAEDFSVGQMRLLRDWCGELGGGLAMIGGPDTFGLGGWSGTPVEEALPVTMELKDKRNFPSLGMVLLIDKSGSMSGGLPGSNLTKLEVAIEAAVKAVNNLTPQDWVGVIGFDSAAKWDAPWQKAINKGEIADQIRTLRPGGGTDAMPAMEEAIRVLGSTQLQLRHVLFLTDGVVAPGDYDGVTRRLRGLGATVTAIGIGTDTDRAFLSGFAAKNGGRSYFTSDPSRVPAIFTKETVLAQRSYLIEGKFRPVLSAQNEIVRGLGDLPQLAGYVNVESRDRAEVILRTQREDPLLATWRFRAGKGLAWTSDARDRWSSDWIGWTGYRQFWEQAARWVLRQRKSSTLAPRLEIVNGTGRVTVDATTEQGDFQNFLGLETTVLTPDNQVRKVRLRQVGAGQYEGEFEARETGSYLATVGGEGVEPATAGTSMSYPPEYRTTRPNGLLLNQLAAATGGRVDPPAKDFFQPLERQVESRLELWQGLLWAALALLLADIAARRVFLDEEQRAQIAAVFAPVIRPFAAVYRRLVPAGPSRLARADAAAATLEALQARRSAARRSRGIDQPPPANDGASGGLGPRGSGPPSPEPTSPKAETSTLAGAEPRAPGAPANQIQTPGQQPPPTDPNEAEGDYTSRLLEARRKSRQRRGDD